MRGMHRTRGYHSCRILSLCTPCTCMYDTTITRRDKDASVPSRPVASNGRRMRGWRAFIRAREGRRAFERERATRRGDEEG